MEERNPARELLSTAAMAIVTFAALELWQQLKDPTSRLRLFVAEASEQVASSVRFMAERDKIAAEMSAELDLIVNPEPVKEES